MSEQPLIENPAKQALAEVGTRILPRILTQVCRDPDSPFFGCFDRNWWHYKIVDFPSMIIQQGAYSLHLAAKFPACQMEAPALNRLARAAAGFWNERALRRGAFEEYYPWEQGYPPLAFSTLAVLKLHLAGIVPDHEIIGGVRHAARQLRHRFESQAANQQMAGLAALAAIRAAFPNLVPLPDFEELSQKTLSLQHEEGWFTEYDGPDLGYLTVTMDCLWDLHDFTAQPHYLASAARALGYVAHFTDLRAAAAAGMHNARNTDYLVPYAIARFAASGESCAPLAARVFGRLYADAAGPGHFFSAIDDRYLCHYIGHSILRALLEPSFAPPPVPPIRREVIYLSGSAHVLAKNPSGCHAIMALRKGGVLSLFDEFGNTCSDYGWIVREQGREYVSHWWSPHWQTSRMAENIYEASGFLFPHHEHPSRPWKHVLLRAASFLCGRHIIKWLKKAVIFKSSTSGIRFQRRVELTQDGAIVADRFEGLSSTAEIIAAPRASKRHVSSADSYQREDLALSHGFTCERTRCQENGGLNIRSVYHKQIA